ncbi:hypothetical protein KV097_11565 [Mumia sp. zg.B17]|uniref:hypothetical protein n=1 Tax=Mumia sp. zg.B17 TaxID=2855446 RepID=UPI001C6F3703|nr:hypothetical protein [Mumia sp. zg.B17]MBW9206579.1 hypothetical protein [Mumia sp. zg.B17]
MRRLDEPPRRAPAIALALLLALAGCGDGDTTSGSADQTSASPEPPATETTATASSSTPTPTTATTPAPSPTASAPSTPSADELSAAKAGRGPVGVWRNRDLQWVLRIKKSGRFVDDFAGVKNIRSGTWRLKGKRVVLKGGDGITTRGRLRAKTLTIKGTVLVRVR